MAFQVVLGLFILLMGELLTLVSAAVLLLRQTLVLRL